MWTATKKRVQRNTDSGLSAFLCTRFLLKWLCDCKFAYETDADFFFEKYGDSPNDTAC